ncbi:hypothetical protein BDV23DRAFT_178562 [Aspergillus alliaceus]|uniref:Uncharacterized protein n=1 Tax=Petromyces alliaceus TaxID=209559 RepID=A0A5N7CMN4_PETAA|nr:hypothetical protein BDV23DRAFT_178562 [Aspergillus alliaceus]
MSYPGDMEHETKSSIEHKDKIHKTGNAILQSADTAILYEWWLRNHTELETKPWDKSQDAVKDKALGKTWRTEAPKAFYTATNSCMSFDEFSKVLSDNMFILKGNKTLPTCIDVSTFKYHLLYNAAPERTNQVLKHDAYNDAKLITAYSDDIQEWLQKYPIPSG